jgi:tryptophan synthase beta chain
LAYPFLHDKLTGVHPDLQALAVEPSACPTLTRGAFEYDFGDTAGMTPLVKMYTLGHTFVPPSIHAGGLRYHGDAPSLSALHAGGIIDAVAYQQLPVFDAAVTFTRVEGLLPAPESAHAIKAAIDLAVECRETGQPRTILFNLSGHGFFDLGAYDAYFAGGLQNFELPEEQMQEALAALPTV